MMGSVSECPVQLGIEEADLIIAALSPLTIPEAKALASRLRDIFHHGEPEEEPLREATDEEARHLFGLPPLPKIASEGW